jgi:hypothetical protein
MNTSNSTNRKSLKIFLLLNLLCFGAFISHAQDILVIHGEIRNQVTGIPIEGVNIRLQNTYAGTSTNFQGVFELRVSSFPATLIITHIGYFGKQIIVAQPQSDSVIVLLSPRMITLGETEITAENQKVFKGKEQEIIDYEFQDTNLLILSYNVKKNRTELILTDEHFDTTHIQDISYLKNPKQLFKDCTGSCHLLTNDSAYQVYFDNQSIQLIYPINLDKFFLILGDCLFETRTHVAFERKSNSTPNKDYAAQDVSDLPSLSLGDEKWNHLFYLVNKNTHVTTILNHVYEWKKKIDAYDHAYFVFSPDSKRSFGDILRFSEMVYYKPAFQTLKILNDTIYYFNHLESRIDVYSDSLVLIDTVHINYHNLQNWKQVIITDKVKNKAYTIFTIGAKYSVSEINLHSGSLKEVCKVEKLFPSKIRINNGYLYFIYNDLNNAYGRKQLHQLKLSIY